MRNLKRVLALAMALVMILGMMVIGSSAASYSDTAAIDEDYAEAVEVLSGLGVFKGTGTGFAPKAILTRAEAATLIYRVISADVDDKKIDLYDYSSFNDVAEGAWYTPYVTYAANEYIKGDGTGNFNPNDTVTGIQVLAIMLRAMGYGQKGEFEGAGWKDGVLTTADDLDLLENVSANDLDKGASRELVAQLLFDAINAPTTSYTPALGYSYDLGIKGDSLGLSKFSLKKVEGVITDTLAVKGTTEIDPDLTKAGDAITLVNTDADWTNVGYAARAWYVDGKTDKALSIVITADELSVTTNGMSIAAMTANKKAPTYVADIVAAPNYFKNGEIAAKADIVPAIGTKIALVDNDNDGDIDAVVATEYIAAKVTNVLQKSVSGEISDYSYTVNNLLTGANTVILAKDLANVDALAKDDYITYIVVDGEYYVTMANTTSGEFNSITRATVGAATVKAYTIDGATYVASDRTAAANVTTGLAAANLKEVVVIVTDEYGYIIYAEKYTDPAAYMLVLDNEDSHGVLHIAETTVAYADGSIAEINVAPGRDVADHALAVRGLTPEVYGQIYAYTTNKAGNIELDYTTVDNYAKATYVDDSVVFNGVKLTERTTIVDLRDVLKGKAEAGTVYTGYADLPGITNAEIVYLAPTGTMTLGFIIGGTDTKNLKADIVVFNTNLNVQEKVAPGVYTYTLEGGVLVNGELVPNYVLSQTQADEIVKYGVGVYAFGVNGALTSYTSFAEATLTWQPKSSGKVINGVIDITTSYNCIFLDIEDGELYKWDEYVVDGEYYAYVDYVKKIAYIVADATTTDNGLTGWSDILAPNGAVTGSIDGIDYVAEYGYVTRYGTELTIAAATLNGSTALENMTNTNDVNTAKVTGAYQVGETVTVVATRKAGGIFVKDSYYTMTLSNGEEAMAMGDGTKTLAFDFTVTAATKGSLTVEKITRVTTPADVVEDTDSYLRIKVTDDRVAFQNDLAFATINESLVAEIYSGTNLLGTVTLKDGIQPTDGVLSVNIVVSGRASSSWISNWTASVDQLPTNVKFIQDGTQVHNALICKTFNADTGVAVALDPADWQALFA